MDPARVGRMTVTGVAAWIEVTGHQTAAIVVRGTVNAGTPAAATGDPPPVRQQ